MRLIVNVKSEKGKNIHIIGLWQIFFLTEGANVSLLRQESIQNIIYLKYA